MVSQTDSQTDVIRVTEEEIPGHLSRYCETTEKLEILLDADKKIWVTEGVPVKDKEVTKPEIEIPNSPYVFMVHSLWVNDENHRNLLLMDVPVIFAHGYREGEIWKFANGQVISETVNSYNQRAKLNNTPTIEFVLSCNEENTRDPLGIKVKDIADKNVAQAVGEVITLQMSHGGTQMSEEGKVTMTVSVEGKFWGLDELIDYKAIRIEPKIDQV